MQLIKLIFRVFLFSIFFCILKFIFGSLTNLINKNELVKNGNYIGLFSDYTINDYYYIFLIIFSPFLIASIIYFYFRSVIGEILYWLVSLIPIGLFLFGATMATREFADIKEYAYLLLPLYLILAFHYNYRMISKEHEGDNK